MLLKRSRSRGRPKKALEIGPTPELMQKRQSQLFQWQISRTQCLLQSWWHLFYHRGDISRLHFILSQDFGLFRHWSYKFNSEHSQWRSPLALPNPSSGIILNDREQNVISGWWHTLLRVKELTPLWKHIHFLYDIPPADIHSPELYKYHLRFARFCLVKLATHWVSRQDFINLYVTLQKPNLQPNYEDQSTQYDHHYGDRQH